MLAKINQQGRISLLFESSSRNKAISMQIGAPPDIAEEASLDFGRLSYIYFHASHDQHNQHR
jgi:hypothetical protein